MGEYVFNPYREAGPAWDRETCAAFESADILDVHRSLAEYQPTPLVSLPTLAKRLGVGRILVKDESYRFGLKAFKALGSTYAIYRFLVRYAVGSGDRPPDAACFYQDAGALRPGSLTFCTATDGNHGRGVAWAARKLRQNSVIYVPEGTAPARIENIKLEGAEVIIVGGSYDDAVVTAAREAKVHGRQIISDTSWVGHTDIPRWINAGYTTIFREIHETGDARRDVDVDAVIIQAGVGALAATAAWYYNKVTSASGVKLVAVEPIGAACLLESIRSAGGERTRLAGPSNTIMAGLNCGTPSLVAWPLVKSGFDLFMSIPDEYAVRAMRTYYDPHGDDPRVVSGESGAAGLAALMALCEDGAAAGIRERLGITSDSTVLLLNTEGDTDPVLFDKIVRSGPRRTP